MRKHIKEMLDQVVHEKQPGIEILKKQNRPTHDEMQRYPDLKKIYIHVEDKMFIINTSIIHD